VNTTGFITQFLKKASLEGFWRLIASSLLAAVILVAAMGPAGAVQTSITELRVERHDDGLQLSAAVNFELPFAVEDALLKGIPMFFVVEADIYRERWYWTDPRVASATRTIRLAYQPLTRRWRINVAAGLISSSSGLRATLNQNHDSLAEAVTAIQRIARWKIADTAEIVPDANHRLEFSFRLDLSQLPRPFQIGVAGQSDWTITAQLKERLRVETPVAAAAFAITK
jgi:Domain of unknown function (DUF4390)